MKESSFRIWRERVNPFGEFKIRLEKLSHCVGQVSRLKASGVPTAGNPPSPTETLREQNFSQNSSRKDSVP